MTLLDVRDLTVMFGGLRAVDQITFSVAEREVFGIIGPNGAGKTTLLNGISRIVRLSTGEVHFDGVPLHTLPAHRLAGLGIARTFQAAEIFSELRLLDYLLLGRLTAQVTSATAAALRLPALRRRERKDTQDALALLDCFGLGGLAGKQLSELPYGLRKLVDILRAINAKPRLLLLDEPTSGTATEDRAVLRDALRLATSQGVTAVVIDHDIGFVADLCGRVLVMNFGKELGMGQPGEVLARSDVRAAYTGIEA